MTGVIYEAKIAAGSNSGLGQYTWDWVQATTVATKCKGRFSLRQRQLICFY